jgi:AcrR family transcriptional regulator
MTTTSLEKTLEDTKNSPELEDGRRARRDRNRDAVVDALLQLYQEGSLDPSSDEIAARAGLSPRSLFRYFDDIDDLCQSAITRQLDRVRDLFELDVKAGAPLADRIVALVEQRVRLFDAIGAAGQVTRMRAPFQPLLAAELAHARTVFRSQIKRLLKPELSTMSAARAASTLASVDVLCSFESYQLLRFDQSLSRAKSIIVLVDTLNTLLS